MPWMNSVATGHYNTYLGSSKKAEILPDPLKFEEGTKNKIYMRDMDLMIADMEKELIEKQIIPGLCFRKGFETLSPTGTA
jgi:hypothetical protein